MLRAWSDSAASRPARSRNESRIGGPTPPSTPTGVGIGSPNCSKVYASVAVMPGAESTIVPSRSNSTAEYGRGICFKPTCERSEQPRVPCLEPAHRVVVEDQAPDAAIRRQRARLRFDLLRGEHAADGSQQRIAVHQLEIPGQ